MSSQNLPTIQSIDVDVQQQQPMSEQTTVNDNNNNNNIPLPIATSETVLVPSPDDRTNKDANPDSDDEMITARAQKDAQKPQPKGRLAKAGVPVRSEKRHRRHLRKLHQQGRNTNNIELLHEIELDPEFDPEDPTRHLEARRQQLVSPNVGVLHPLDTNLLVRPVFDMRTFQEETERSKVEEERRKKTEARLDRAVSRKEAALDAAKKKRAEKLGVSSSSVPSQSTPSPPPPPPPPRPAITDSNDNFYGIPMNTIINGGEDTMSFIDSSSDVHESGDDNDGTIGNANEVASTIGRKRYRNNNGRTMSRSSSTASSLDIFSQLSQSGSLSSSGPPLSQSQIIQLTQLSQRVNNVLNVKSGGSSPPDSSQQSSQQSSPASSQQSQSAPRHHQQQQHVNNDNVATAPINNPLLDHNRERIERLFIKDWDKEFNAIQVKLNAIAATRIDRMQPHRFNDEYTVEAVTSLLKLVKKLSYSWKLPKRVKPREQILANLRQGVAEDIVEVLVANGLLESHPHMIEQFLDKHRLRFLREMKQNFVDLRPQTITIMKRQFDIDCDDATAYSPGDIFNKFDKVRNNLGLLHSYIVSELMELHGDRFHPYLQMLHEASILVQQCLRMAQTSYQTLASYYNYLHTSESCNEVDDSMHGHDLSLIRTMPIAVSIKPGRAYHRCCEFALAQLYLHGLRKPENDDMLYRPLYTEKDRYYTHTYVNYMTLKSFCSLIFTPEVNPERYSDYMATHGNMKNIITFLMEREHKQLPKLKKKSYCFSFDDGVYNAKTREFTEYTDIHGVIVDHTDEDATCANYFPMNFQKGRYKQLKKYIDNDMKNYMDIPTPAYDTIFETQGWPQEVREVYWALYGRMFFPVGFDNWQVFPWFIGYAATGKSTIVGDMGKTFCSEDVSAIGNNTEVQFGLEARYDKFLVIAPDVKAKFNLEPGTFQSMASGEKVEVNRKFRIAKIVEWVAQMLFASNVVPRWDDQSNSIARRLVVFRFNVIPTDYDTELGKKLDAERPFVIRKATEAYFAMREKIRVKGKGTLLDFLPKYFEETRSRFQESTNSLVAFLTSGSLHFGSPLQVYMPEDIFIKEYRAYCTGRSLAQQPWNPDSYEKPLTDRKCAVVKPEDGPKRLRVNGERFTFPKWARLPYHRPPEINGDVQESPGGYQGTMIYGCDVLNTTVPRVQLIEEQIEQMIDSEQLAIDAQNKTNLLRYNEIQAQLEAQEQAERIAREKRQWLREQSEQERLDARILRTTEPSAVTMIHSAVMDSTTTTTTTTSTIPLPQSIEQVQAMLDDDDDENGGMMMDDDSNHFSGSSSTSHHYTHQKEVVEVVDDGGGDDDDDSDEAGDAVNEGSQGSSANEQPNSEDIAFLDDNEHSDNYVPIPRHIRYPEEEALSSDDLPRRTSSSSLKTSRRKGKGNDVHRSSASSLLAEQVQRLSRSGKSRSISTTPRQRLHSDEQLSSSPPTATPPPSRKKNKKKRGTRNRSKSPDISIMDVCSGDNNNNNNNIDDDDDDDDVVECVGENSPIEFSSSSSPLHRSAAAATRTSPPRFATQSELGGRVDKNANIRVVMGMNFNNKIKTEPRTNSQGDPITNSSSSSYSLTEKQVYNNRPSTNTTF